MLEYIQFDSPITTKYVTGQINVKSKAGKSAWIEPVAAFKKYTVGPSVIFRSI